MTQTPDQVAISDRVARFGLPAHRPDAALSIDDSVWPGVLSSLKGRRITGLAAAGAEDGWLQLSDEQTGQLLEAHRQEMLAPLTVERGLLELSPVFEGAGVEFLVLKGPAVAHAVYPDPSWRFFGDLDLLIRAQDWRRACAILEELGFQRNLPEPRPGFVERFGGAPAFRRLSGGVEVDLHRTLVAGAFGLWADTDRLFAFTAEFRIGEKSFRRLDDTSLLLHACIHASLGNWPPLTVPLRDVAQVAHCGRVDWDALLKRSVGWSVGSVVRHAFEYTSRTLGVSLPPEAGPIIAGSSSRRERRALQAFVTDRRNRGGTARSTLSAIPGIRAKSAYVRCLLFPDRTFLAARQGGGRPSYLGRWRIALRWLRRGRKARAR